MPCVRSTSYPMFFPNPILIFPSQARTALPLLQTLWTTVPITIGANIAVIISVCDRCMTQVVLNNYCTFTFQIGHSYFHVLWTRWSASRASPALWASQYRISASSSCKRAAYTRLLLTGLASALLEGADEVTHKEGVEEGAGDSK